MPSGAQVQLRVVGVVDDEGARGAREPGVGDVVDHVDALGGLDLDDAEALLGDRYLPPEVIEACSRRGVPIVEPDFSPLACLAVASRLLSEGRSTEALALLPIYARPPAVTLPRSDR